MKPTTIFCDEAGFDGNNLWNPEKPYFVYAAVNLPLTEADAIVAEARSRFSLNSVEIHAAKLLRRDRGRDAIAWILEQISTSFQVICIHKRYGLACKLFEYLIEPAISAGSTYFYDNGFHKFISNGLYFAALTVPGVRDCILTEFQSIICDRDAGRLGNFLSSLFRQSADEASFLDSVATILICNRSRIEEELQILDTSKDRDSPAKWLLELSLSSVRTLCSTASGPNMRPLIVVCDDSKPLRSGKRFLEPMVGQNEFRSISVDGCEYQLSFNLFEPIRFASSTSCSGIQLADVAATSAAFALKHPFCQFSRSWFQRYSTAIHEQSVFPDHEEFDLNRERVIKNAFILEALVDRSLRKVALHENLSELDFTASIATKMYRSGQLHRTA